VRTEDNRQLARDALPCTALHPAEGKGVRPRYPAQLRDRAGSAGGATTAVGQITSLLCVLSGASSHHVHAAYQLLPGVDKEPSFQGMCPGLFPSDALPSFLSRSRQSRCRWPSALWWVSGRREKDAELWNGSFQGPD